SNHYRNSFVNVLFGLNSDPDVVNYFVRMQPFWKVVADGSSKGSCVVGIFLFFSTVEFSLHVLTPKFPGVLEANFIEPAHDKQDFERSVLFIRKGHCHLIGYQPLNFRSQNVAKEAHIRKSAGHSTNPQNQLLADQQDTDLVAEHQNNLSLNQPIMGHVVTGMQGSSHEQL
ncbi:Protein MICRORCHIDIA 1, partial [Mucuna pruriens]